MAILIIFDLDGVLTDTAALHAVAWQGLARRHEFHVDADTLDTLRGRSRAESLRTLLGTRHVSESAFDAMLTEKNADYVSSLNTLGPHDLLPGALRLLRDAKGRGWKLALGSSSKNAQTVVERLDIAGLFDVIVDGNSVAQAKPAPEVFVAAAEALGVPVSQCVVVEDAAAGVAAAHAAGMRAVGVGPPSRVGTADYRVADTGDIDLDVVATWFDRGGNA